MKILILLDLNLSCLLPMLLFMLGAFLLGWLLKHLFGREKRELAELHITHDELNSKHNAYVSDSTTNIIHWMVDIHLFSQTIISQQKMARNLRRPN